MNLQENYRRLKSEAYAGIRQKRSSGLWIAMLEATPLLLGRERGNLLLAVNTGMRILDDIADGDRQPPLGASRVAYLQDKQAFIQNPQDPQDEVDHLFTYCYELANTVGIDIHEELNAFFSYFLFDARRLGTREVFPQAELDEAYDACDIWGTIRGSLKVFGDDPEKTRLLFPLGKAVRIFYSPRDYEQDVAAGFVNIPQEAIDTYEIRQNYLPNRYNPAVRKWFREEARVGLGLLEKHRAVMQNEKFRLNGRLVLPIAYENPTRAYLQAVLADHK